MAFIDGDCSLKLLYLFFYISLGCALRTITFSNDYIFKKNISNVNSPTIISFLQVLFYFLDYFRNKKIFVKELNELKKKEKENKKSKLGNNVIQILSKKEKKIKFKLLVCLIICGLSEVIRLFYKLSLTQGKRDISYYISGPLLLEIIILSYYILNVKSYKHHYFCIIVMFFADFLMAYNATDTFENIFKVIFNIVKIAFNNYSENAFDLIVSAPKICIEKYMMHYLFANPYLIIYFEGIIQIIFMIGVNLYFIFYDIFINEEYIYLMEQKLYINEIINNWYIILLYFLILLTIKFMELLINQEFGPSYLIISSTAFIYYKLYEYFIKGKKFKSEIQQTYFILYAIIPFLFSEIIILNFCGLGKNTRKIVSERERRESNSLEEEIKNFELSINML